METTAELDGVVDQIKAIMDNMKARQNVLELEYKTACNAKHRLAEPRKMFDNGLYAVMESLVNTCEYVKKHNDKFFNGVFHL